MKKRDDPYRNFKFRITWNGRTVAAFRKVRGLAQPAREQQEHAAGQTAGRSESRGWTAFEAITFERGVTHDREFEQWANRIWDDYSSPGGVKLRDLRKDLRIEETDEAGQLVRAYNVFGCWVSDYQAMPDLDAGANAIAIETIVIQNEGWEHDSEPSELTEAN